MCGIVWLWGADHEEHAVASLKRLEYRGYDSFGFSVLSESGIQTLKSVDDLRGFSDLLPAGTMTLGHTRWATHGAVSLENSHPHVDCEGRFALVHNGLLANFEQLSGVVGGSDTAFMAATLTGLLDQGLTNDAAFSHLIAMIEGRNTLVCMFASGEVFAYREGSPLVLVQTANGIGLASDLHAFGSAAKKVCFIENGERVLISTEAELHIELRDSDDEVRAIQYQAVDVVDEIDTSTLTPGHFMQEEIFDQWRTLALQARHENNCRRGLKLIQDRPLLIVTGAGGAGLVADQIAELIRSTSERQVLSVSATEIQQMQFFAPGAVLLAVSQSGETADTLVAMELAQSWGMPVMALVNSAYSTMSRVADYCWQLGIGPEQCVLSTKSATAQIGFGYWLGSALQSGGAHAVQRLNQLGQMLCHELQPSLADQYEGLVRFLENRESVFLLGRGAYKSVADIGALNLKEASYLHAEAFGAGELKHGVIALVEADTPVILFNADRDPYMQGVAAELRSRGARLIFVGAPEKVEKTDFIVPVFGANDPVTAIISCQLLALYLAIRRGINPDRPRNLAKSVTVL